MKCLDKHKNYAKVESKYKAWISKQSPDFIKEIHPHKIPNFFRDDSLKASSLEELEILTNKYILNPEEIK